MPELGQLKRVSYKYKSSKYPTTKIYIWYACIKCGKARWVRTTYGKPNHLKCASCALSETRHKELEKCYKRIAANNWEGARTVMQGYPHITIYPQNFFYPMASKLGRVAEHRLVMAKHLKRCLLPWEIVHHKNGICDDNRIENLELVTDKKFHLIDSAMKSYIVRLNKRIEKLEMQVKLLQWRINEHEKTNQEVRL
jgi:hypothetical protein